MSFSDYSVLVMDFAIISIPHRISCMKSGRPIMTRQRMREEGHSVVLFVAGGKMVTPSVANTGVCSK